MVPQRHADAIAKVISLARTLRRGQTRPDRLFYVEASIVAMPNPRLAYLNEVYACTGVFVGVQHPGDDIDGEKMATALVKNAEAQISVMEPDNRRIDKREQAKKELGSLSPRWLRSAGRQRARVKNCQTSHRSPASPIIAINHLLRRHVGDDTGTNGSKRMLHATFLSQWPHL